MKGRKQINKSRKKQVHKSISRTGETAERASQHTVTRIHRCPRCKAEYAKTKRLKKAAKQDWERRSKIVLRKAGIKVDDSLEGMKLEKFAYKCKVIIPIRPLFAMPDISCNLCRREHIPVGSGKSEYQKAKLENVEKQAQKVVKFKRGERAIVIGSNGTVLKTKRIIKEVLTDDKPSAKVKSSKATENKVRKPKVPVTVEVGYYYANLGSDRFDGIGGIVDLRKDAVRFKAKLKDGSIRIFNTADTPLPENLAKQLIKKLYLTSGGFKPTKHSVWPELHTVQTAICPIKSIVGAA